MPRETLFVGTTRSQIITAYVPFSEIWNIRNDAIMKDALFLMTEPLYYEERYLEFV